MLSACGSAEPETVDAPEETPAATQPTLRPPADPCAVLSETDRKRLELEDGQPEQNRCMWLSGPDRSLTDGELRVLDVRFKPNSSADAAEIVYRTQKRQAFATDPQAKPSQLQQELARIGTRTRGTDYDEAY